MKKSCRRVRDLLGPYLDHELNQDERSEVDEHLKTCPLCRQELAELETLQDLAHKVPYPSPSEEHLKRLRWQINRSLRRESRPNLTPISFFRLATLGGALVVMMVVVIAGYRLLADRSARPGPLADTELERRLAPAAPTETTSSQPSLAVRHPREAVSGKPGAVRFLSGETVQTAGRTSESEPAIHYKTTLKPTPKDMTAPAAASGTGAGAPAPVATASARGTAQQKTEISDEVTASQNVTLEEVLQAAFDHTDLAGTISWSKPDTLTPDTGTVELLLWVEPDSSISSVKLLRSSGNPVLDSFALRQALKARALPELKDGRPVRVARRAEFRQSAQQQDNQ